MKACMVCDKNIKGMKHYAIHHPETYYRLSSEYGGPKIVGRLLVYIGQKLDLEVKS